MRILLLILLPLFGFAAGAGTGLILFDTPAAEATDGEETEEQPATERSYAKMNSQFIVPVMEAGKVVSLIVLSLSLELATGQTETVMVREPKLRAAFLQLLFDHANNGGFSGSFTEANSLLALQKALREEAQRHMGKVVTDVLITEIGRQDS